MRLYLHSKTLSMLIAGFYTSLYKAVSLNEDVDMNKELLGHVISNLLAGPFGVV